MESAFLLQFPQDPIVNRCVAAEEKATQRNSHRESPSEIRDVERGNARELRDAGIHDTRPTRRG